MGGDGIYRQIRKRLKYLEKEILKVQTYLKQFEEGDLICAKRAIEKMQNYTLNGIIPSIHLITTYETKDHPLSTMEVEEIVEKYFG